MVLSTADIPYLTRQYSMTPFDPTKPVRTRNGRAVRILCTDAQLAGDSIVALVENEPTNQHRSVEFMHSYRADGRYVGGTQHNLDLVNVPQRHVRYINVYRASSGYLSRDIADANASDARIACLRLDFEEGQFDD